MLGKTDKWSTCMLDAKHPGTDEAFAAMRALPSALKIHLNSAVAPQCGCTGAPNTLMHASDESMAPKKVLRSLVMLSDLGSHAHGEPHGVFRCGLLQITYHKAAPPPSSKVSSEHPCFVCALALHGDTIVVRLQAATLRRPPKHPSTLTTLGQQACVGLHNVQLRARPA